MTIDNVIQNYKIEDFKDENRRKSVRRKSSPIMIKRNNNFLKTFKIQIRDNKILKKNYKLKNDISSSENKDNINQNSKINLKSTKNKDKKRKNKNKIEKIKSLNESKFEYQLESEKI